MLHEGSTFSKLLNEQEVSLLIEKAKSSLLDEDFLLSFFNTSSSARVLTEVPDFYREGDTLYMQGIKVGIPEVLAEKFESALGSDPSMDANEYNRLKNFWSWCTLNPNSRSRNNLYKWIDKHGVQITPSGLMLLYRKVECTNQNNLELARFVLSNYYRLKRNKAATSVGVYKDVNGGYTLKPAKGSAATYIGALSNLFKGLSELHMFTDNYSKTYDYRVGVEARMKREDGDESDASCSEGFHGTHGKYGESYGNVPVAILVNPMDILNVVDGLSKMRFTAFTIVGILDTLDQWMEDKMITDLVDITTKKQIKRLESLVKQADFNDLDKHEVFKNKYDMSIGMDRVLEILKK